MVTECLSPPPARWYSAAAAKEETHSQHSKAQGLPDEASGPLLPAASGGRLGRRYQDCTLQGEGCGLAVGSPAPLVSQRNIQL